MNHIYNGVMAEEMLSVTEFYTNKSVLITGVTGFMGKVLLEKLIRSCPGINKLYILIRGKRDKTSTQRFHEMVNTQLFDKVRDRAFEKVALVDGDMTLPSLGIKKEELDTLKREVAIVFHFAATVKFNEPLKLAIEINVLGTKMLLEMSREFKKLEAWVYVSTAFSNGDLLDVEEKVYPCPLTYQQVYDLTKVLPEDVMDGIYKSFKPRHCNTYTFSKLLTENLVYTESENFPAAIFRPSMVTSVWKEPIPGFTDNQIGLSKLIIGVSSGMIHTLIGGNDKKGDLIPVDVTINHLICTAWYTAIHKPAKVKIYNSTADQSICWSNFVSTIVKLSKQYPLEKLMLAPYMEVTDNYLKYYYLCILNHNIPAILMDLMSIFTFQKPRFLKHYKNIHFLVESTKLYMLNEWNFSRVNIEMIWENLSKYDKQTFYFEMKDMDFNNFCKNIVLGNKKYVFKEDLSQIEKAKNNIYRRQKLYTFGKIATVLFIMLMLRPRNISPKFKAFKQKMASFLRFIF